MQYKINSIPFSGDGSQSTYRIAFVTTHPIQYFAPLFAYLTRHCGLNTTALYLTDFSLRGQRDADFQREIKWDINLMDGYEARFIGGEKARRRNIGGFFSIVAPELWYEIRRGRYDAVIIHGYNLAAHHVALAACKSTDTLVFARGDTNPRIRRSRWKALLRRFLLRIHYGGMDGALAVGKANADFYRYIGVPDSQIFIAPFAVDNDRFSAAAEMGVAKRFATRAKLGMDAHQPAVLFAAKLTQRKRPIDLLDAFAKLKAEGVPGQLVIVGTGELEAVLKERVAAEAIPDVFFLGFINQADLPEIYAASDLFVIPSIDEPWGLAVNEAMCAGLPIIAAEGIGCVDDLVEVGVNGATFPPCDTIALAGVLKTLLMNDDLREAQGKASRARIRSWSYQECGMGIREAIETTQIWKSLNIPSNAL